MNHIGAKKAFTTSYLRNLSLLVFVAIIGGIATGYFFPHVGLAFMDVGDYFFKILEVLILPVIFFAIVYGICQLSRVANPDRMIWQTVVYFILITSVCIVLGFSFAFIIQPGKNTAIDIDDLVSIVPSSYEAYDDGSLFSLLYLNRHAIFLFAAISLGTAIHFSSRKAQVIVWLDAGINGFVQVIKYLYISLPLIIFCNITYSIAVYGIDTLLPLSKVLATVYLADIVFVFGVLGIITRLFGIDLWSFLLLIKEEILLVMTTSSSKTAFPMIFDKLHAKGYDLHILGFVIPLGYCFNLAGACIYISVSCVFFVQLYNISLTFTDYVWLFIIISFTSKTASGVPGSGFLALIFTLSRFGKIPMTDVALLYSLDRFMNEARSVTNFIGIAVCGAVIAKINDKGSLHHKKATAAREAASS
ncbi:cation:dicarboxylase symporter family transporter [Sphingobacterium oryzagri]|uniref:Cation:dicarboxylase symporter family transporter n=1 Tax=Sphingobacterium oryzagri TaxID=3025669 RepID=A0ABY7WLH9_9SPHI|nr:cation:dicarboxylase symporter family transporter [Sphingobacterium sp. KACC 22765]WDF69175.1 cation:dicarboxylase symporter family transporter [Sphingobacterium sp. KACC 22765]